MYKNIFPKQKIIIGMIHLPPLPGYLAHPGMDMVIRKALTELQTLEQAGFDGVLVENDNDQPHYIGVPLEIKKAFGEVMQELVENASIPVGMEIIYDMKATLEVAKLCEVSFVRFDVFVDTVDTKWGRIEAQAAELMELKNQLDAATIVLLTDVHVKHATMVEKKTLKQSTSDSIHAGADGLIVTGTITGQPPSLDDCLAMKSASKNTPVLIGSGLTQENADALLSIADGAIVGTSIKTGEYVNGEKAKKLIQLVEKVRKNI